MNQKKRTVESQPMGREVTNSVSRSVKWAVEYADEPGTMVAEVAGGAARGAVRAGYDLAFVGRNVMLGVLRGAAGADVSAVNLVRIASRAFAGDVAEHGGDVEGAARGLTHGAIAGGSESGIPPGHAASAVAQGVLDAADSMGPSETERAAAVVTEVFQRHQFGGRKR